MGSTWGDNIKISIFGESHGPAIGVVIDGLPAGEEIDDGEVMVQMSRRAPGQDISSTPRSEADIPEILSGTLNGRTTGAPICAVIRNTNTRSSDYNSLLKTPRPSHADYSAHVRYNGFNDISGSGHFSGRLTAPLTFAGAVCRQILKRRGITVGGHVASVCNVSDDMFGTDISVELLDSLNRQYFAVINNDKKQAMSEVIEQARLAQDSVGGVVEVAVAGMPAGIGSPMFGGVENRLSSIVFGVPAVKGVEFGAGFGVCTMRGSEANDPICLKNGEIKTETNNNGGITGGITNSMPIIMRAAVKPTPSISKPQRSVDMETMEAATLVVKGRHDPCIVPRALPAVEAAVCVGLIELLKEADAL